MSSRPGLYLLPGGKRHGREDLHHQRKRWIARRLALRRWWVSADCDSQRLPNLVRRMPRPLEAREAEFWTPTRCGYFGDSNGSCSCWMCSGCGKWRWRKHTTGWGRCWERKDARIQIAQYVTPGGEILPGVFSALPIFL